MERAEVAQLTQDLRQPLATITALALAGRQIEGIGAEARRLFTDILEEARRATALCREVPTEPVGATSSLGALAERAALRARARFGVDVTVDAEDIPVVGNVTAWRVLLDRLLEDACRATGTLGDVEVSLRAGAGELVVAVDDSGSAYPSGRRLSTSGLDLAQRLAEQHGGRVTVGQSELGGASVRLVVPQPD